MAQHTYLSTEPATAPMRGTVRRRTLWQEIVAARLAYLLLLPIFLVLGIFVYFPPLSAIYHAFFNWDPTGTTTFVGLGNFQAMLSDSVLLNSVWNMVRLLAFALVVTVTIPLIVAELIYAVRNETAKYAYRFLFLVPVVVPTVVVVLIWKFLYDPQVGLFNDILGAVGLSGLQRPWLGDFVTALPAVMLVGFPFASGTSVLIYLAGLLNIPGEVMEAAALDGATGLRRIWRIDLPLLLGQIKLFIVLGIIAGVQAYELQLIMTDGGPGYATEVPGLRMYQAGFEDSQLGYASAIGLVLFLVVLVLTLINFRFIRSSTDSDV